MLEKVSKDLTKRYRNQDDKTISSFHEVYLTYLAEVGYSTYLGLSICLDKPQKNYFFSKS